MCGEGNQTESSNSAGMKPLSRAKSRYSVWMGVVSGTSTLTPAAVTRVPAARGRNGAGRMRETPTVWKVAGTRSGRDRNITEYGEHVIAGT